MKTEDHDGPMSSGCTLNTESSADGEKDAGHEHNGGGEEAGQRNFGSELAAMTQEQLVALATNQQKAIASLATVARQSPGSGSRAPMMSTVAKFVAVGAVLVGVYIMAPPHYKENVFNYVNNTVNITAIIEVCLGHWVPNGLGNRFINYIPEEKAVDKFKGMIPVDENDSSLDITKGEKKYKNFEESHVCQVKGRVQPDKYDMTIDNIGNEIGLTELQMQKMKLSLFSETDAYVMSRFVDSSNGMYIYGRFEAARNWNNEMDFVVAFYKVSWTLPSAVKVKSSKDELYAQWCQLHDGTNDMVPEQGKKDLKKKFDLFLEVNLKGDEDEAATMKESKQLEKYLRQLADEKNKDECKPELITLSKKQKTMDEG